MLLSNSDVIIATTSGTYDGSKDPLLLLLSESKIAGKPFLTFVNFKKIPFLPYAVVVVVGPGKDDRLTQTTTTTNNDNNYNNINQQEQQQSTTIRTLYWSNLAVGII